MADPIDRLLADAVQEYHEDTDPRVKLAGLGAARDTVRKRRRVRATMLLAIVLFVAAGVIVAVALLG